MPTAAHEPEAGHFTALIEMLVLPEPLGAGAASGSHDDTAIAGTAVITVTANTAAIVATAALIATVSRRSKRLFGSCVRHIGTPKISS